MGSQERLMTIMWRLLAGQTLTKRDLMAEFGKDESIIRRDIAVIKHSWQAAQPADGAGEGTLIVSPAPGQYRMQQQLAGTNVHFDDSELLAMLLILTNSRALNNSEMSPLLAKLVASGQDHTLLDWVTKNDRVFYRGVPARPLLDRLLTLGQTIRRHETITFTYTYEGQAQHFSALTPTGLYFGDLFFYLVTGSDHQPDDPDRGTFTRFRISRISHLMVTPPQKSVYLIH
ncbi:helix-turn-helix transcriptional regulator [Schleiferilactobacillus shenzhenensis]|uniref:WYL domain-containing protein n=1 Tax=Schleiferilactobacillus shenzhenensis LY-73 TaxID=1231336 RepID=U4TNP0_9LACO|nr:hypothetical protein [Schleiferilactobacillus shenzhenensis]ERL65060.1 hypothetical protein L248_2998 [Schleiferilactobacillus shenzhenensis LY-73]